MDYYGINVKRTVTADGTPDLGEVGSTFGTLYGEATSAQWGDLAEKYSYKGECPEGTVMCVSDDIDVDVEPCSEDLSTGVIGIISLKPGFKMNEQVKDGIFVGLVGKIPVRIIGSINKKDFIVPTANGCARAGKGNEIAHKIGVSLETNTNIEEKLVECIVK